jgi:hypothetical protein
VRTHRAQTRRRASPASPRPLLTCFAALVALVGFTPAAQAQTGIRFDGVNDHVTFGAAPALGSATFTIETWFRREGVGVTTTTGTGGVTAIPLVTKGRGEGEGGTIDMNWFLGIRGTDSVLVADFEDAPGGANHPVAGTRAIRTGVWYHVAATYDGATWRLYLNGALEAQLAVGATPQAASIQHAALATAMNSSGAPAGYFLGTLDETRVWNVARSAAELQAGMTVEIVSGAGLVGRWGMNEGAGTTVANAVAGPSGTLVNGPTWVPGATFATEYALRLGGTNAYASFGTPAALQLSALTIEMWIRRDGAGVGTNTGSGGIADAIPLFARGRADADEPARDINYLFGIRASDGVLCADFEEGAGGASPSLNHPVAGVTAIATGAWHHVAATYDGTWKLYLDGALEASLAVGQPMAAASTVAASLGSALTQAGAAAGFFHGAIDEVRVWSHARTAAEIFTTINDRITTPQAGLVARWALDDAAGAAIAGSAGTAANGSIAGTNWTWTGPAPFDVVVTPPAAPTGLTATAAAFPQIALAWTDASTDESRFEIERSLDGSVGPFAPLATVAANATTYADGGLTPGVEHCYRIRAANAAGASDWTAVACATPPAGAALDLGAAGAYVSFGAPASLQLAEVTIEMWIRRDGAGVATETGTGGIPDAIPLLAKGRADTEDPLKDINYFLGLRASDGVLCADFEEGAGGAGPAGQNHPVTGVTAIPPGEWHHVAATYDGVWKLYVDGVLDAQLAVNQPLGAASTVAVALGSALTAAGVAAGAFDGAVDEVRIWSVARTGAELQASANAQLELPQAGLVARWALDEGGGAAVGSSAGTLVPGTIAGTAWSWTAPAPFDLEFNQPPDPPVLLGPPDARGGVTRSPVLAVAVADLDDPALTVSFHGRRVAPAAADFTLIGIPDTQYYTSELNGATAAMLNAQTQWIVAERAARDIVAAFQLGDCTEHGDNGGDDVEWRRADAAFARLEDPGATGLPDGVPFGIAVGNHDQSPAGDANGTTTFYNQFFGSARFQGRDYYGGHYGSNNDNWYVLFEAGGMAFIAIGFEYDTTPDAAVLDWADALLVTHATRRAIVVSHNLIGTGNPGAFSTQGNAIYQALKDRPNLFLMLGGHVPGEGRRADTFEGRTVHTLLSDYQSRTNGGNGWMRVLEFSPAQDVIRVRTYSPVLDQWEADADSSSQFTLAYDMTSGDPYALLGTVAGVSPGATATLSWPDLDAFTEYEWYAVVSDGHVSAAGPTWRFTTGAATDAAPPAARVLALGAPVPHPVRAAARMSLELPEAAPVELDVVDVQGRRVATIAHGRLEAGHHSITWNVPAGIPSGLYFVHARVSGHTLARPVVVVR